MVESSHRTKATRCDMPASCVFSRDRDKYYYWDSFEVPLSRAGLGMTQIYLSIFSHPPAFMKWMLILRTKIVSLFGIGGPSLAQFKNLERKESYSIGEKIALFTLYSQDAAEIVTGGNDKHLDFRVSVQKLREADADKVVLTTVVTTHNFFGKLYLFFILPFHRFGVKTILSNAVTAQRL